MRSEYRGPRESALSRPWRIAESSAAVVRANQRRGRASQHTAIVIREFRVMHRKISNSLTITRGYSCQFCNKFSKATGKPLA
jgi:hypothetical protein